MNNAVPDDENNFMARMFEHMNPSSLQTLRQLDLKLDLSADNEPHDPLIGLPGGLARMPAGNNLREISITIFVCEFRECSARSQHWEPLDGVLGDRGRFSRLERVKVLVVKILVSPSKESKDDEGRSLMDMSEVCFSKMRSLYGTDFTFQLKL